MKKPVSRNEDSENIETQIQKHTLGRCAVLELLECECNSPPEKVDRGNQIAVGRGLRRVGARTPSAVWADALVHRLLKEQRGGRTEAGSWWERNIKLTKCFGPHA